ncbi:uncharacterized protein [Ptychodera flava]|uniref:uncharacterized protein n=1 Tax=Ptychodera flava TaxID=63121 RepID=UPI00396AAA25
MPRKKNWKSSAALKKRLSLGRVPSTTVHLEHRVLQDCHNIANISENVVLRDSNDMANESGNVVLRDCNDMANESGNVVLRDCKDGNVVLRDCNDGNVVLRDCKDGNVVLRDCKDGNVVLRDCKDGNVVLRDCKDMANESGNVVLRDCKDMANECQNAVLCDSNDMANESGNVVLRDSDDIANESGNVVLRDSNDMANESGNAVLRDSNDIANESGNVVIRDSDDMANETRNAVLCDSYDMANDNVSTRERFISYKEGNETSEHDMTSMAMKTTSNTEYEVRVNESDIKVDKMIDSEKVKIQIKCSNLVQGSFNQSHAQFGENSGRQCVANSYVSVLYSKIKNVQMWNTCDMDLILQTGNELYGCVQQSPSVIDVYLLVTELPQSIELFDTKFKSSFGQSVTGLIGEDINIDSFVMSLYNALVVTLTQYDACFVNFGAAVLRY